MAWYDEAIFYHIYPLGLCGAPKQNAYEEPVHRLNQLIPWISHIKEIGCNAIYIGPLFESVGHGYETTDYKKLDSRLGTNDDLKAFVRECHSQGIRVIFDGVFNHTGRDFFAFQDIKKNRENSPYLNWYCNVNFWGNNEYNDGFSYDNWGGFNLLVKLNQKNPDVIAYICDVIRFWVSEFDVDGIRLDAADVLDFDFMKALRSVANQVKPEFWLMGEVIHGDYNRWVNEGTLHSVTNYHLHKALYSGNNEHNFFEIAHTVRRLYEMGGNHTEGLKLYNFVDNHDVERIYTKLTNKAHFAPVHVLLYTLPGIPSIYYGSEFGIEGRKERYSDDSLRPALQLADYKDATEKNPCTMLIQKLGKIRQQYAALSYGDYKELLLTNRQYAYSRNMDGKNIIITVNNDDNDAVITVPAGNCSKYVGALTGKCTDVCDGRISVNVKANSGEIWIPENQYMEPISKDAVNGKTMEDNVNLGLVNEAAAQMEPAEDVPGVQSEEETVSAEEIFRGEPAAEDSLNPECRKVSEKSISEKPEDESHEIENAAGQECNVTKEETADTETSQDKVQMEQQEENLISRPEKSEKVVVVPKDKTYEEMTVEELQAAIIDKMAKNGPVTEDMKRTVYENVWTNSLLNWVKSFR